MIEIIVAVPISIVAGLWVYARWNFGTLEKLGIPVVEYTNPLLGSIREMYTKPGGLQDVEWMRKYGKVFGVYEGRQPSICICDRELVRLICVKDQEYFNSKGNDDLGDPILNEFLEALPYEKWKIVRNLSTPAFTSAKLKMMNLPMRQATLDFVADIKDKIGEGKGLCQKLEIDREVHTMLTDLISRAYFSVNIDRANKSNEFVKIVREMLKPDDDDDDDDNDEYTISDEIAMYTNSFPFIRKIFKDPLIPPEPVKKFASLFKHMLDVRWKSGEKPGDILDMCLEWWDRLDSPEFQQAKISELTLLCQALVFFAASQDQISTMVATIIYHMTQDPELERRMYEEVDQAFDENNGKIEHEHLSQLALLNACIHESLRMYAAEHRTGRVCTRDWKNEEFNLEFKKGANIVIPIWALNRCEEYNENPEDYIPDRWMPENIDKLNPYSSTSFGFGPRNCPGKRFAMEAMPLILVYLLKELKFVGRKDSEIKFVADEMSGSTPHEPIYSDVELRKDSKAKAPTFRTFY